MTSRKNETPVEEDAFGTPPAARGGMMKVAGATDDDVEPGERLLSDCDGQPDEYRGNDAVGAPYYPREGVVRVRLGDLRGMIAEVIRKTGSKYSLYTKHKKGGKRRKLGSGSLADVKRQERAIHAHAG